jgi:hypothetical protein
VLLDACVAIQATIPDQEIVNSFRNGIQLALLAIRAATRRLSTYDEDWPSQGGVCGKPWPASL